MSSFKTLLFAAAWLILCNSSGAQQRPNILIILADDAGVDVLRIDPKTRAVVAQVTGKDSEAGPVKLPCLERMAKAGVHFKHAWANPVCTPTRSSFWTGTYPWKNTLGFPFQGEQQLPEKTVTGDQIQTLAQALGLGYRKAMIGKWDLGEFEQAKTPVQWGWDHYAGTFRGGLRADGVKYYGFEKERLGWALLNSNEFNKNVQDEEKPEFLKKRKAAVVALQGKYSLQFLQNNPDLRNYIWEKDTVDDATGNALPSSGPEGREYPYATKDQVEDVKKWIAANKGAGPWCVALNLIAPHDPFHVPPSESFKLQFKDPAKPTVQEMLTATLQSMDYYLNDLLAAIDDQLANTVVIFVCDNGTQDNDPDARPTQVSVDDVLLDDKTTQRIGGVHVPMLVADGGLMKGGPPCYLKGAPRSVDNPVHIIDIYNTVLDIAGVTKVQNDSKSMAPLLTLSGEPTRKFNFSQMYDLPFKNAKGIWNTFGGINASATDSKHKYKLTCVLPRGNLLDRKGQPTEDMVFSYEFTELIESTQINGLASIPGSYVERKIDALRANDDGTFTITKTEHKAKIHELYGVLSQQRLTSKQTPFPVIGPTYVKKNSELRLRLATGEYYGKYHVDDGWLFPKVYRNKQDSIVLQFVGDDANLTHGSSVSIKSHEKFNAGRNLLVDFERDAIVYWSASGARSDWIVERADGDTNTPISFGDRVRFKNRHFGEYLEHWSDNYLSTEPGRFNSSVWIIEHK